MKKLMILFLLVSFMCFGEEQTEPKKSYEVVQGEKIDFLKTQLMKSNNKIDDLSKKIEKLEDKEENNLGLTYNVDQIYQNSVQYYDKTIEFLKWLIGGMLLVLGYLKWDGNKKYEKERKEITKEVDKRLERMWEENIELKGKIAEQEENIKNKTLELYETIKRINKRMNKKIKTIEFNTELAIAINKNTPKEKVEELKKLAKKYPQEDEIYFGLGYYLDELKKFEDAIEAYNKFIDLCEDGNGYNNRGVAKEGRAGTEKINENKIKYYREAIEDFNEAIKLNSDDDLDYKLYIKNKKRVEKKLKELKEKE